MKKLALLLLILASCHRPESEGPLIVSIQIQDRNGLTETISAPERLENFQTLDFLASQPYKKILRVFKQKGKHTAKITTYHSNGQIWKYLEAQDMRAFGTYKEWHPNGRLKIEATVIGGSADVSDSSEQDWLFDGIATSYDSQGKLLATIPYEKGVLHGTSLYFYPSGQLEKESPFVQNELQGMSRTFSTDGKLHSQTNYHLGLKTGKSIGYSSETTQAWVEEYEEGLLQEGIYLAIDGQTISQIQQGNGFQCLFNNGSVETMIEYRKGKAEGLVKQFSPQGTILSSHYIKNGKKQGEELFYYAADEGSLPKLSISWEGDLISGLVKTWYPSGKLQSEREFSNNQKMGPALTWYQDGQLMNVEEYEEDTLVKGQYFKRKQTDPISSVTNGNGFATLFDGQGAFLRKVQYVKGKPLDPDQ
jgi:antitoxin component YwqK of YwqJK toxin-antitoxin module